MSDVKSKNLYELLGNDHDQDSDKEPEPPTKAIDKPLARSGKRDGPQVDKNDAAPRTRDPERRRGGFTGSEQAFRDRTAGSRQNRDNFVEGDATNGRGGQRGGRGPRGPRRGGDRHSRTGRGDHQKQVEHGWGRQTGEGEQADEKAGDRMAAQEIKEDGFDAADPAPPVDGDGNVPAADAAEEEPEDSHKSYADYLAEQAQKKLEGLGLKEARAPNEGSKEDKKWKSAKELSKENDEEHYFIGEAKAKRERDRITKKNVLDIDYSFKEQRESAGRGRGGRGRGDRGGRGRGEFRGGRGGERGGERGSYRGSRGSFRGNSDGPSVAVGDESAFPALGGK